MNESLAFHLLNRLPGCGAKTIRLLVGHFGSAKAAWEASSTDWGTLQPRLLALSQHRSTFTPEAEAHELLQHGIDVITFTDLRFPKLLSEIPDAPALLYVRGGFRQWNERPLLALVGSRKFTHYGRQVAQELTRALSQAGYVIVSGLAFGIDAIAHEAALEMNGVTLAILGSGIDDQSISPQSHLSLAKDILPDGVLLSELAPGTNASVGTFPARNRIMAGMCQGIIVIEAAEGSGSLITARLALDYNREVFAVPGSIFSPSSTGTHQLIQDGARLVTGIQDILKELSVGERPTPTADTPETILSDLDSDERLIYQTLSHEGLHIDNLIATVRLETMRVNMALTRLELRGLVKNIGNMHYTRAR
ncbi:MAG: DNA-processing protein DprA [Candidatus Moraniibacteriota bacterium]